MQLGTAIRVRASASRTSALDFGFVFLILLVANGEIWLPQFAFDNRVGPVLLAVCATTGAAVTLLWRRRAPIAVLSVVAAITIARAVLGGGVTGLGFVAPLLVANYAVARYETQLPWAVAASLSVGLVVGSTAVNTLLDPSHGTPAGFVAFTYVIFAVVWALGRLILARELTAAVLLERAGRLEQDREEHARQAVSDERARIARELHDVVAHGLSVIIVQAQAAAAVIEQRPETSRRSLTTIEDTARQAMAEMRRLVGILDDEGDSQLGAPQPGLARLPELVAKLHEAGPEIDLATTGEPRPLPPGLDLAAYRVVQESLTNVLKHAGARYVEVRIDYRPSSVSVEVRDDGRGSGSAPQRGHGLMGLRQRVALYDARLDAGDLDDGGFMVRAVFPTGGEAA